MKSILYHNINIYINISSSSLFWWCCVSIIQLYFYCLKETQDSTSITLILRNSQEVLEKGFGVLRVELWKKVLLWQKVFPILLLNRWQVLYSADNKLIRLKRSHFYLMALPPPWDLWTCPRSRFILKGDRAFAVSAPRLRNDLPEDCKLCLVF